MLELETQTLGDTTMLLQPNYYAPLFRPNPLMRWAGPMLSSPTCPVTPDSSFLSMKARQMIMMNSMLNLLSGFQGPVAFQGLPTFGLPGRGLLGPAQCLLGPGRTFVPTQQKPAPVITQSTGASVKPLRQGNSISCGQTSVAMAVNSLTGKKLTDADINRNHGFSLLSALKSESRGSGYTWRDGGNFKSKDWKTLETKLNGEKTPVIMGLNGSTFSPSGRGHIITLLAIQGDKVKYADPADGKVKTVSKQVLESAPGHPHGKFFFYASKV